MVYASFDRLNGASGYLLSHGGAPDAPAFIRVTFGLPVVFTDRIIGPCRPEYTYITLWRGRAETSAKLHARFRKFNPRGVEGRLEMAKRSRSQPDKPDGPKPPSAPPQFEIQSWPIDRLVPYAGTRGRTTGGGPHVQQYPGIRIQNSDAGAQRRMCGGRPPPD